jgi:hypothetical protein
MFVAERRNCLRTIRPPSRNATSSPSTASTARSPTRRRPCSRSSTDCAIAAAICSSRAGCRWSRSRCARTCAPDWAGGWSTRSRRWRTRQAAALAAYARAAAFDWRTTSFSTCWRTAVVTCRARCSLGRTGSAFPRDQAAHHGATVARLAAERHRPRLLTAALGCAQGRDPGCQPPLPEAVNGGTPGLRVVPPTGKKAPRSPKRSPRPRLLSSQ